MKIKNLILAASVAVCLASCEAPKLGYFQGVKSGDVFELAHKQDIRINPGDKLSILVSSKTPELAYLYNLPVVGHYQSATSGKGLTASTVSHYTVDANGDIDFPILGKMHIAGMTRSEIGELVKNRLVNTDQLKDPTITVDFLDMYFSVMGEVLRPGRFIIDHDKVTLLDALSQAGDLTINGRRDNVLVTRVEDGKQIFYRVDLSDSNTLYSSPAFYLRQNDIVFVEPNAKKAREATAVGNAFLQPSLWISVVSLATSIAVLVKK